MVSSILPKKLNLETKWPLVRIVIICLILYPSQWNLHNRYYRSVHLKLKPYSCEKCQKSFTLADTLKKHMIWAHSNERPHNCDKCNKSFAIKNQLANHVKVVHEKMRRFECSHCHMKFGQKATLEKHVARFVFYFFISKNLHDSVLS